MTPEELAALWRESVARCSAAGLLDDWQISLTCSGLTRGRAGELPALIGVMGDGRFLVDLSDSAACDDLFYPSLECALCAANGALLNRATADLTAIEPHLKAGERLRGMLDDADKAGREIWTIAFTLAIGLLVVAGAMACMSLGNLINAINLLECAQ